jgi:hypothetical protein
MRPSTIASSFKQVVFSAIVAAAWAVSLPAQTADPNLRRLETEIARLGAISGARSASGSFTSRAAANSS